MTRLLTLAVKLVVIFGCCVFACPPTIRVVRLPDGVSEEELADPDSLFTDVDGLRVHYKVAGEGGRTVVLLHGFAASTYSWRKVMEPLSALGTVVSFDRPAFGLTARPMPGDFGEVNPYSPEAQVELTVALMDQLGVEKAVLVGHSAGGTIALLTALSHPERVEALVLEDAAIYETGGTPTWLRPFLVKPCMGRLGPILVRTITLWGESVIRRAWDDPDKITVELISGYKKPLQAAKWDRALWQFLLASHPLDLEERLDEVSVPTLVITGERDRFVPTRSSERLARELPQAQLVVVPDCGHVPHEECAELFLRAVTDFMADLP